MFCTFSRKSDELYDGEVWKVGIPLNTALLQREVSPSCAARYSRCSCPRPIDANESWPPSTSPSLIGLRK